MNSRLWKMDSGNAGGWEGGGSYRMMGEEQQEAITYDKLSRPMQQ